MYNEIDETFEFKGVHYIVKQAYRHMWPCQHCDLCDECIPETHGEDYFPKCLPEQRDDMTQVIFRKEEDIIPERPQRRRRTLKWS